MRVTAGHIRAWSVTHGSVEDQLFELSGLYQFSVDWSSSRVSIGLELLSVNNWFGFIGYRLNPGIFFQVKFGYELIIIIDRVNITLIC